MNKEHSHSKENTIAVVNDNKFHLKVNSNSLKDDISSNINRLFGKNISNIPPIVVIRKKNKEPKTKATKQDKSRKSAKLTTNKENISILSNIPLSTFEFTNSDFKKNATTKPKTLSPLSPSQTDALPSTNILSNGNSYLFPPDTTIKNNPLYEYANLSEITFDLFHTSTINKPQYGKFSMVQREITQHMKRILFDWLIDVHDGFSLRDETLYLCFNLIERFLSYQPVKKSKFQLLGTTCLFLASKYEEIYPPGIDEFVIITDNSYKVKQVIKMEEEILKVLKYEICCTYAYTILQRLHFISQMSKEIYYVAEFLLETSFFDDKYLKIDDFDKALAALYYARRLVNENTHFPKYMKEMFNEKKKEIIMFCKGIIWTIKSNISEGLISLEKKFRKKCKFDIKKNN